MMKPYRLEQVSYTQIDSPLLKYAVNVASQSGEDGIISRIFSILEPVHQYCVEFGGWDGKHLSNCYNLIENREWSGAFIEADENRFRELLDNHGSNSRVTCVNQFVNFEGPDRLDTILTTIDAPRNFDLLSIDIDGADYFIWESLQDFTPTVVVIEFNPTVPNDILFVQAKDCKVNQGCSLLALIILGKQKGYELICCTAWNAFFVRKEFYNLFGLKSNFINHLYRPVMDGRIFHGFDSQIHVHGMPRLIWSGIDIDNEQLQVLPVADRVFRG